LIHAADETHQWSASYDRELRDVLSLQSEVARAVAKALAAVLLPAPAAASEIEAGATPTEAAEDLAYGAA
jgi:adenylate cyclase